MKIKDKWENRSLSEVLAMICKIADIASSYASMLEIAGDLGDWPDSTAELRMMCVDIEELVSGLNCKPPVPIELLGRDAGELLHWLQREDSTFDQYEETI